MLPQFLNFPLEEPASFDAWFASSMAASPEGVPIVLYHGTNAHAYVEGEIEAFHTQPASGRGGAFFTTDKHLAAQYGEKVYEVNLSLQNPLIIHGDGKSWAALSDKTRIEGAVPEGLRLASQKQADEMTKIFADLHELFGEEEGVAHPRIPGGISTLATRALGDIPGLGRDSLETDDIVKVARKMGFDGVVFRSIQDSPTHDAFYAKSLSDIYVAFFSSQIRHVPAAHALDERVIAKASEARSFMTSIEQTKAPKP